MRNVYIGVFVALSLLLSGAVLITVVHSDVDRSAIIVNKGTILTLDGKPLGSFFDGLAVDESRYNLRLLTEASLQRKKATPQCTGKRETLVLRLMSVFERGSVHADQACFPSGCTGERRVHDFIDCVSTDCKDQYENTKYDPLGPINIGFRETGTEGCRKDPATSSNHCTCQRELCSNGRPPDCVPCDQNDPMTCNSGERCDGLGCCSTYTCPDQKETCRLSSDCSTESTCSNGCCDPKWCIDDFDCSEGYYCDLSNHVCRKSNCLGPPLSVQCKSYGGGGGDGVCPEDWQSCSQGCCQPPNYSPILIDEQGDGYSMTPVAHGVVFDMAGNGGRPRVSWTTALSDDGWLGLDRNLNGRLDDGTELFGNVTAQPSSQGGPNGFEALKVYDQPASGGNGDGRITSSDQIFARLVLWRDLNHNGISEPQELFRLSSSGIRSISLDYKESKWSDIYGNHFRYRSRIVRNQGHGDRWAFDVFLATEQ